jgi:hypothetical protein
MSGTTLVARPYGLERRSLMTRTHKDSYKMRYYNHRDLRQTHLFDD